jgi:hypothetical protein
MNTSEPLMTRRQVVEHVKTSTGIPLKLSSFTKLCAKGDAPEPASFYGRVELYDPRAVEEWARRRLMSAKPVHLRVGRSNRGR